MAKSESGKPGIIVLGLPRSGTTLVRRILDAHPSISCSGETFLLRATARFFLSDTIVDGIDYGVVGGLDAAGIGEDDIRGRVRNLAFSILEEIAAKDGKPRWASKTAVDAFHLDEIERLYGEHAQFVCVIRHGADVACSLKDLCDANEVIIDELRSYVQQHPRPLQAFAHAWAETTDRILDFSDRHKARVVVIRYEDLVADPGRTVEELFRFLGESVQEGLLQRALDSDQVRGLGDWKTYERATIDSSSVGRWKNLRQDTLSRLGAVINPALERCGYEPLPVSPLPGHAEAMHRYELSMRYQAARSRARESD